MCGREHDIDIASSYSRPPCLGVLVTPAETVAPGALAAFTALTRPALLLSEDNVPIQVAIVALTHAAFSSPLMRCLSIGGDTTAPGVLALLRSAAASPAHSAPRMTPMRASAPGPAWPVGFQSDRPRGDLRSRRAGECRTRSVDQPRQVVWSIRLDQPPAAGGCLDQRPPVTGLRAEPQDDTGKPSRQIGRLGFDHDAVIPSIDQRRRRAHDTPSGRIAKQFGCACSSMSDVQPILNVLGIWRNQRCITWRAQPHSGDTLARPI